MNPKPGWTTTQFWLTLFGTIGAFAVPLGTVIAVLQRVLDFVQKAHEVAPGLGFLTAAAALLGTLLTVLGGVMAAIKAVGTYGQQRTELYRPPVPGIDPATVTTMLRAHADLRPAVSSQPR